MDNGSLLSLLYLTFLDRDLGLLGVQCALFLKISHPGAPLRPSEVNYVQYAGELLIPRILASYLDLKDVVAPR